MRKATGLYFKTGFYLFSNSRVKTVISTGLPKLKGFLVNRFYFWS